MVIFTYIVYYKINNNTLNVESPKTKTSYNRVEVERRVLDGNVETVQSVCSVAVGGQAGRRWNIKMETVARCRNDHPQNHHQSSFTFPTLVNTLQKVYLLPVTAIAALIIWQLYSVQNYACNNSSRQNLQNIVRFS